MIVGIVDCGLRNPVAAKFIDEEKDISPRFSLRQRVLIYASIRHSFPPPPFCTIRYVRVL